MILPETSIYNYHSHTQYCDGHASMDEMAAAACDAGMEIWGFSPHSPIAVESKCNMTRESVPEYLEESRRLKDIYSGRMKILTGMEIDYLHPISGHTWIISIIYRWIIASDPCILFQTKMVFLWIATGDSNVFPSILRKAMPATSAMWWRNSTSRNS